LRSIGSHLAYAALVNLAYAQYQERELSTALRSAREVERFAGTHEYHALRARALWITSLVLQRQGAVDESLRCARLSISAFERVHESVSAGAVASTAADTARNSGDDVNSWDLIGRALATVDRESSAIRQYLCFYNAALFARHDGLLDAALVFQNEAVIISRAL